MTTRDEQLPKRLQQRGVQTMSRADQMAAKRADKWINEVKRLERKIIAIGSGRCAYCNGPEGYNVDFDHRYTPLCDDCYYDEHRHKVTARCLR
jgi:hypothetical protein